MDMQSATAPGGAWARAFDVIGQAATESLEKFRDNRKKKEIEADSYKIAKGFLENNQEMATQIFGAADDSERDAVAKGLAKSGKIPDFINTFSQLSAQAEARKIAQENRTRDLAKFRMTEKAFEDQQEDRKSAESHALNMFAPSFTEDPDLIGPPNVNATDSPIVQLLPENFKPQGRALAQQVREGKLDPKITYSKLTGISDTYRAKAPTAFELWKQREEIKGAGQGDIEYAQKQEDREKEQKIQSFDGLKLGNNQLKGSVGDTRLAEKLKIDLADMESGFRNIDRLIELGTQREEDIFMSEDLKVEADNAAEQVRSSIRAAILGAGTVQKDEYERLARLVPNPTRGLNFLNFSATYGEDGNELLRQLRGELMEKMKDKLAHYNIEIVGPPKSLAGQAADAARAGEVQVINLGSN